MENLNFNEIMDATSELLSTDNYFDIKLLVVGVCAVITISRLILFVFRVVQKKEAFNKMNTLKRIEWYIIHCNANLKLTEKCKDLIQNHSNLINASRSGKYTLFQIACLCGNEDIVQFMLSHGADAKKLGYKNRSAVYLAIQAIIKRKIVNFNIIKILIEYKAPINQQDDNHFSPLMLAALYGHKALVKFLLLHGADPMAKRKNMTPWRMALQNGHEETAALLFVKN